MCQYRTHLSKKVTIYSDFLLADNRISAGVVLGLIATEYGYVSANEMATLTIDASKYGLGILKVEQAVEFHPCRLADIDDSELQEFLSGLYD